MKSGQIQNFPLKKMSDWDPIIEMVFEANDQPLILGLMGQLGAGKTSFVKYLADKLGVKDEVSSPTYTLHHQYDIPDNSEYKSLEHFDLYRLEHALDPALIALSQLNEQPGNIVAIEWPEIITPDLPVHFWIFNISIINEETGEREVVVYRP